VVARSRRRARGTGVACLLVGVLALVGCSGSDQPATPPAPVAIGLLLPLTGATAATSADAMRGIQLAVDVVNHSYPGLPVPLAGGSGLPGLSGRALTLVGGDTTGRSDEAANQAGQIVAKGAVALVTADSADVTVGAGSEAGRLRVPLIDARSTADYVTELGMDWYFRTAPSDRLLAQAAFALLQQQFAGAALPKLAVVSDPGAESAATTVLVRELAERAGYPIATQETLPDNNGPSQSARRIEQSGADVVLALVNTPAGVTGLSQVTARLTRPIPVIGLARGFGDPPPASGGSTVLLRTASWSAELAHRSPAAKAVDEMYTSRFGAPMTDAAANAFTAMMTLAAAIDAAGSTDPGAIRAALRSIWQPATQIIMPWNGVRFDADGQNQLAAGVVEGREAAGFRVVFPRELATGPMIWTANGTG
jgi:branched-chain amino acid transport system substrate-binding protein